MLYVMKDKLVGLAEKVKDEKSFLGFVRELINDKESAVKKRKTYHLLMAPMLVGGKIHQ